MTCPACQTLNPEGAMFCLSCGTPLAARCPRCATPLAATGQRFCHNCGLELAPLAGHGSQVAGVGETSSRDPAPVTRDPAQDLAARRLNRLIPPELRRKLDAARVGERTAGERRIVTMLFCDVKGSTALAEQLDPEEWTAIMNGAFEHLIRPVYRYEGTVARLMGDSILAFFGAPIAHEDDPRRAVLAGLEIVAGIQAYAAQVRRETGHELDVRVGINTGLVVVGEVGSDLRMEYTAMGDAANLAARMEQTAVPGTVQVAGPTYRLVEGLFDVEPLGALEVKGKAEPVPAYRVLGVRAGALPTRGIRGLHSPLVGRDRELAAVRTALDELRLGRGQLLSIQGEAGLGKSRLLAEVRHELAARGLLSAPQDGDHPGPGILWLEGRSFSYETARPYTPFADLLGRYFGLRPDQPAADAYARLRERVAAVAPEGVEQIAPFLASLLGVPVSGAEGEVVNYLEPPQLRAGVFRATAELFARLAAQRPVLLLLEDLHWADPTSLELLERLLPVTEQAMLGIAAAFRPQRDEPSWRFHEAAARDYAHRYTAVALAPLAEAASRELVGNLLHVEDLPEAVRSLILQKAEGNPFFVEEVIRSLLDAGLVVREGDHWRATREIANISVPDTLAGVITARLDRLEEEPRQVAQEAAVIGREFPVEVLGPVHGHVEELDRSLTELERRELVRERSRVPARVYRFKHGLTQETAYASILLSRRRELHRQVAECLERTAPDSVTDLAHHYLEAREEPRALPYVLAAGDRAARAYASAEAVQWYRRALEVLLQGRVEDPALARRAFEGLAKALELTNDLQGALETYNQMRQYAEHRQDLPTVASALNKLAYVAAMRLWELPRAEEHLADAERVLRASGDPAGFVEHAVIRCGTCLLAARFDAALGYLGESVEAARKMGIPELRALSLGHYASTLVYTAAFEEAWRAAQECLKVAEPIGDLVHVAEMLTFPVALAHLARGDLVAAATAGRRGVDLAARIGALHVECSGAGVLASVAAARGDYEEAIAASRQAIAAAQQLGPLGMFFLPMLLTTLGSAYAGISPALYAQTADEHLRPLEPLEAQAGASAWADLGFAALEAGQLDRAEDLFGRGLSTPTPTWLLERARLQAGMALVYAARGSADAAATFAAEARAYATQKGMCHLQPLLDFVDARGSVVRGDLAQAAQRSVRGAELAERLGLRPLALRLHGEAAGLLEQLGHATAAAGERRAAERLVERLAASVTQADLRDAFLAAHAAPVPAGVPAGVVA